MWRALALAVLVLAVLLTGCVPLAAAQERVVQFEGRVQWLSGQLASIALDTGGTVSVDLSTVPQDEYATLRTRDRIVVRGVIPDDDPTRVLGTSVRRLTPVTARPARPAGAALPR